MMMPTRLSSHPTLWSFKDLVTRGQIPRRYCSVPQQWCQKQGRCCMHKMSSMKAPQSAAPLYFGNKTAKELSSSIPDGLSVLPKASIFQWSIVSSSQGFGFLCCVYNATLSFSAAVQDTLQQAVAHVLFSFCSLAALRSPATSACCAMLYQPRPLVNLVVQARPGKTQW